MKECPLLDECEEEIEESNFEAFCKETWTALSDKASKHPGYMHCPTYHRALKLPSKKPREWKKAKKQGS